MTVKEFISEYKVATKEVVLYKYLSRREDTEDMFELWKDLLLNDETLKRAILRLIAPVRGKYLERQLSDLESVKRAVDQGVDGIDSVDCITMEDASEVLDNIIWNLVACEPNPFTKE